MKGMNHALAMIATSLVLSAPLRAVPGSAVSASEPQDQPAAEPATDDAPPTLDELLGLDEDETQGAAEQADRRNEQELERRLAAAEINDAFELALEKMAESALLLDVKLQPGLGTQRVQLEVLAKLDQLIDKAKQMQSKSMSSSSSSSQSQSDKQQPTPGPKPDPQAGGRRQPGGAQDGQAIDPPGRQDGDINSVIEESGTEWGHLPQRFREMLLQGRNEKFSSLYERLTREYYKRLAEEG